MLARYEDDLPSILADTVLNLLFLKKTAGVTFEVKEDGVSYFLDNKKYCAPLSSDLINTLGSGKQLFIYSLLKY